jgi:hypothetical protein
MEEMPLANFDQDWHDDEEAEIRAERFFRNEYQDRGMVKWQGYFLSDHTENFQKYTSHRQAARAQTRMPEMSAQSISDTLAHAYANNRQVSYQTSDKINGFIPPILTDRVLGLTDERVILENTTVNFNNLWWVHEH